MTVGAATKVNVPADVAGAADRVTLTVTAPLPAAVTAVIWVAELTVKLAAAVPPKLTAVAPVKFGAGDDDDWCHQPPGPTSARGR